MLDLAAVFPKRHTGEIVSHARCTPLLQMKQSRAVAQSRPALHPQRQRQGLGSVKAHHRHIKRSGFRVSAFGANPFAGFANVSIGNELVPAARLDLGNAFLRGEQCGWCECNPHKCRNPFSWCTDRSKGIPRNGSGSRARNLHTASVGTAVIPQQPAGFARFGRRPPFG